MADLVTLQRHPAWHAAAAETDVDDPLAQLEDRERTGTPSGPGAKKKGEGEGSGDEAEADVTMDPGEEEDDEDNDDYYQASTALTQVSGRDVVCNSAAAQGSAKTSRLLAGSYCSVMAACCHDAWQLLTGDCLLAGHASGAKIACCL